MKSWVVALIIFSLILLAKGLKADEFAEITTQWPKESVYSGQKFQFEILLRRSIGLDSSSLATDLEWSGNLCKLIAHDSKWLESDQVQEIYKFELLGEMPGDLILERKSVFLTGEKNVLELELPSKALKVLSRLPVEHDLNQLPRAEWDDSHFVLDSSTIEQIPEERSMLLRNILLIFFFSTSILFRILYLKGKKV